MAIILNQLTYIMKSTPSGTLTDSENFELRTETFLALVALESHARNILIRHYSGGHCQGLILGILKLYPGARAYTMPHPLPSLASVVHVITSPL